GRPFVARGEARAALRTRRGLAGARPGAVMAQPRLHDSAQSVADAIVERLDGRIVLALPLGLGKAVSITNALHERAVADPRIDLTVFTALTLEKPGWSSDMERRFVAPLSERLFPDYRGLRYVEDLRGDGLPDNIRVS